ncbi:MAG: hypothetical protein KA257_08275 [Opitutaceae bacterium]|nr:hypothetical protein [Opitutaceae bacterium]
MSTPPSGSKPATHTVHLSRTVVWFFGALLILPWLVLLYLGNGMEKPAAPAKPPVQVHTDSALYLKSKPGPWGELQFTRIVIEPPESLIAPNQFTPRPATWTFKGYTPEAMDALVPSLGFDDTQRRYFTDRGHWETVTDAILLHPAPEFILSLSADTRAKLYTLLAEYVENPDQNDPFRFRADAAEEWFQHCDLSPETIGFVKKLLYRRGTSLLFSDLNLVLPTLPTLQARTRLIKTLARKSTLLVKLRIRGNSDVEALDNYWGRGQRGKDIRPLLQSLARDGGDGTTIDIIHLLPRLPRSLLYTYPLPTEPGSRTYLDCHWTVLNFFNAKPDDRFQNIDEVTKAFLNDYYPVTGALTFGDILLFAKPNGAIIHSCVYLADDIVYTKNGASPNAPWILMSLSDVIAFYPSREPLDIQYYRSKALGGSDNN